MKKLIITDKTPPEDCSGGSGVFYDKDLKHLEDDPIAREHRPLSHYHSVDAIHLSRYDNTNLVQWHGRTHLGHYIPFGPMFEIVD